ncbi:MAG: hypothetical protein AVDCRST_MAG93-1406, partial [uncultured Chloroflexia bacterium]
MVRAAASRKGDWVVNLATATPSESETVSLQTQD